MTEDPAHELVDVVDEADRVIGRLSRVAVRARNLRHRAVYVLVLDRLGRLFVHLRTAAKDVYPAHYDVAVGGVPRAGEGYREAAVREMVEELGVTGASLEALFPVAYGDATTVVNGMVFRCVHDGPFRLQAEEIVSGEFLPVPEVVRRSGERPFCPDGLAVLARYLDREREARKP
jgi:isopentenyldiphosphate isomerase